MNRDTVLIVEDEVRLRAILEEFLTHKGLKVLAAGTCEEAERLCRSERPDAAVLDYELPDGNALDLMGRLKQMDSALPIIILTGYGSIELAVEAVKMGADQFLTKPAQLEAVFVVLERSLENHRSQQARAANRKLSQRGTPDPFIGKSASIRALAELANRVLNSSSPILIEGETGTGKGVLARWLHQNSSRSARPFVDLNCAGLSRELLETELFGHEKGAFTGAVQTKTGLLEIGDKGAVFLDEIGDLDLQVQPKLLKVLEEKNFRRLGDVRERLVDIRLIAASHRDLRTLVREKKFRDDLYFRISTITLHVPPLRERVEDIPMLARWLLDRVGADMGVHTEVSDDALEYLQAYSWPGNVRELRNILERAVLLGDQKLLTARDLHFDPRIDDSQEEDGAIRSLADVERSSIERALALLRGNVTEAAKRLGIPRSSLYSKIKEYKIGHRGEVEAHSPSEPFHPPAIVAKRN